MTRTLCTVGISSDITSKVGFGYYRGTRKKLDNIGNESSDICPSYRMYNWNNIQRVCGKANGEYLFRARQISRTGVCRGQSPRKTSAKVQERFEGDQIQH